MKYYQKMQKLIKRIGIFILLINNYFYNIINKKKFIKKIALVTSRDWQYKIKEDILIKINLNKNLIAVDIVCWEDKSIDYQKYDAVIIKSIWGYQKDLIKFEKLLEVLKKSKVKIFNNLYLIKNNYNKQKQYQLFQKNSIPCIETKFIFDEKELKSISKTKSVIKPIISASGDNTFVINSKQKNGKTIEEIMKILDLSKGYMLQPFVESIEEGEYSVIFIDNKITHVVKRYSGIFTLKSEVTFISLKNVGKNLIDLANKIVNLNEYDDALFLRIDFVKSEGKYLVLETELLEPSLFIESIKDKKIKKQILKILTTAIIKRI